MSYIGNSPISAAFLTDTFSGTGSQVAYTMTVAPANTSSIIVAVTGVLQDPSTYSVSGTTLTFSAAPPSGTSNISVRYLGIPASGVTTTAYRTVTNFTATAGQTSFTIPSYTVGYVDVYRNGVYLPTSDYTATTGTTVVLTNAATVGDTITTISFYVSSVLNAIPATAGSVSTSYLVDGSVTQAKLSTNVAGNGPAFRAKKSSNSNITSSTFVKLTFDTTDFNLGSCYDASTSKFTPTVAGYYSITAAIGTENGSTISRFIIMLYKNGSSSGNYLQDIQWASGNAAQGYVNNGTDLLYLNGTSDYVEVYAYLAWTGTQGISQANNTRFSGFLARAA